jgi:anti-anti-sigma regulatory factor
LVVELRWDAAGATATVTGDLDMATAPSLTSAVRDALDGPPDRAEDGTEAGAAAEDGAADAAAGRRLTLDLAGVAFCDSAGISALVEVRRACADEGWSLRLVGLQPGVRRVIVDFTGLGEYLDVQ